MTSAVWGSQWFILQAHVYTPAIQVKHVPAMCTFQEHSRGEVEWGSDSSTTRREEGRPSGQTLAAFTSGNMEGLYTEDRDAEREEQVKGESGGHGTWSADRR